MAGNPKKTPTTQNPFSPTIDLIKLLSPLRPRIQKYHQSSWWHPPPISHPGSTITSQTTPFHMQNDNCHLRRCLQGKNLEITAASSQASCFKRRCKIPRLLPPDQTGNSVLPQAEVSLESDQLWFRFLSNDEWNNLVSFRISHLGQKKCQIRSQLMERDTATMKPSSNMANVSS